jgi:hypothetical protein
MLSLPIPSSGFAAEAGLAKYLAVFESGLVKWRAGQDETANTDVIGITL